ncbi:hypothetical protein BDR03DRAFT_936976 [Suillus americanus]|nr:hypothetical protein BDR03DRAFT_936976 [Suillus americanus]
MTVSCYPNQEQQFERPTRRMPHHIGRGPSRRLSLTLSVIIVSGPITPYHLGLTKIHVIMPKTWNSFQPYSLLTLSYLYTYYITS